MKQNICLLILFSCLILTTNADIISNTYYDTYIDNAIYSGVSNAALIVKTDKLILSSKYVCFEQMFSNQTQRNSFYTSVSSATPLPIILCNSKFTFVSQADGLILYRSTTSSLTVAKSNTLYFICQGPIAPIELINICKNIQQDLISRGL